MWIGARLPEKYRGSECRDLVSSSVGMVSTLTSMVLGLLLSVAATSFSATQAQLNSTSSDLMRMNHWLRIYGPEADDARTLIRAYAGAMLQDIFPDGGRPPDFEDAATLDLVAQAENKIALLSPANDTQRWLQPHILTIFNDVTQQHFELVKERHGSLPPALVLLLFVWLALLFAARGLFVPRHKMSLLVHLLTSAAAAGAILMIMDLETPAEGFVRLSAEPLQHAIAMMDSFAPSP